MDNLSELVDRLRKARPDLAGQLPRRCECGQPECRTWTNHDGQDEFGAAMAENAVVGVCAKVLAKAGSADIFWHKHTNTYVWNNFDENGDYIVPPCPDFLTAIVSAVIALKETP